MLYNFTDNTSALAWLQRPPSQGGSACSALLRIFAAIQSHGTLGINVAHIKGVDNIIADAISRPRFAASATSSHLQQLMTAHPSLTDYRRYLPSPELVSLVSSALCSSNPREPSLRVELGQLAPAGSTGWDS